MVKLGYTVVVSGATGAVGRDLVAELVRSPNSTKVVALTRREIPKSDWATAFPLVDTAIAETKLEVRPVNFDALPDDLLSADGADASFCCLGTTRNGKPQSITRTWPPIVTLTRVKSGRCRLGRSLP